MIEANFTFTCKDCPDREPGCHDKCEQYKREKSEYERRKKEVVKEFAVAKYQAEARRKWRNQRAKQKKRYIGYRTI